ncbi:MAG: hypothetical protein KIS67_15190 [Verrucomicrobiae bacterium]|nr:hypothetical protein [Verrucomicrobiae bacterium]
MVGKSPEVRQVRGGGARARVAVSATVVRRWFRPEWQGVKTRLYQSASFPLFIGIAGGFTAQLVAAEATLLHLDS